MSHAARFKSEVSRILDGRFTVYSVITDLPPGDPWRVTVWPGGDGRPHAVKVHDWSDPERSAKLACERLIAFYEKEPAP